ncbi:hypothetical protein AVEN_109815-1 [Araneus ventricosus]|uniref:Uncharacterized protein n=1 Tax=Araneus ventricosus TaxID=182803 RepID=A0A4Y2GGV0_ARAVE|nr:hypothetical protein AVEN_109815-1 [Araneus ventricosus]
MLVVVLGFMNDLQHGSSQELRLDLTAITGHAPSEGCTSRHRSGDTSTSYHYYTHQGSETPLAYPAASHLRSLAAPTPVGIARPV